MPTNDPQPECPSFEQSLAELEEIVHELEDGKLGLAEALARYEAGVKLLKKCHALLEGAERRIEILSGVDAQGNPLVEPFAEDAAQSLEEKSKSRSRRRSKPAAQRAPRPGLPADSDVDEPGSLF